MDKERITEAIADALEIDEDEVVMGKKLEEYDNFDSLVFLTLISLLEDCGVSLSSNDLEKIVYIDDIYKIASFMEKWNLSILTNPFAFHFCITSVHTDSIIDEFIRDLKVAIHKTKESPDSCLTGTLAIYGSAAKVENSLFTSNVVNHYIGLLSSRNIFKLT